MKIISTIDEDHHLHSFNFSDGMNTIDTIVEMAPSFGLKKITITDHSQALLDHFNYARKCSRSVAIKRWENIYNDIVVNFGVEADLLDENGTICDHIQGKSSDGIILAAHKEIYRGNKDLMTQGYIRAIKQNHEKIMFIGHLDAKIYAPYVDVAKVIEVANNYGIPLEFNCANHIDDGKIDRDNQKILLAKADKIIVNSDAHTLNELRDLRKIGYDFLRKMDI